MTKDELIQAVRDGRFTSEDFEDEDEWAAEQPESYLAALLESNDLKFDGADVEYLERSFPEREYTDQDIDGQPVKVVFKIEDSVFIAIGSYDSWDGEHFPTGVHEAELVNVPTWMPKACDFTSLLG